MAGYIRYDGKPLTKRYKHNESLKEWNVLATALKVQTALYEDRNDLITTSCQDPTFWKTLRPQLTLRDTWEELQSGQRADWLKCSESTLPLRLHPNFGKSVMEVEPDGGERDKLGELCILDCKWQWRSKRPFPRVLYALNWRVRVPPQTDTPMQLSMSSTLCVHGFFICGFNELWIKTI